MTELQRAVLADLLLHGPSTAKKIGERTERNWRSVQTCLTRLRADGWVHDGSIVYGVQPPFRWLPGPKPATWQICYEPPQYPLPFHGWFV